MTGRTISTGAKLAAFALAASGAMALAGCEEHSYPTAAPTAAPAQGDASLAGAPTTRTPEYVPPQGGPDGAPAYPPPPGMGPQAYPPPGYAPPAYPPPGYPAAPPAGPPEIVTMRPIPNPPEPTPGVERPHHHRLWRRYETGPVYAPPGYAGYRLHPRHRHHPWRTYRLYPVHPHAAAPVHAPAVVAHGAAAPQATAPAIRGAQLPKPIAPDHRHHHHHAAAAAAGAATAAAASGGSTQVNESANATANASGSEADRYQALEQSLKDAFSAAATLAAPAHMEANAPATVTLTLPATFADTVRTEAAKQGLGDQAATVNLTAALTGDGYAITPDQPQSMALTANQPTTFSWKVTPNGAGRGALKAAVRAQLVGAGHDLDLGAKSTGSGSATGRVVGIGLLALIALVLLGWAAQRRRPAPTGAVKPRVANFDPPASPKP